MALVGSLFGQNGFFFQSSDDVGEGFPCQIPLVGQMKANPCFFLGLRILGKVEWHTTHLFFPAKIEGTKSEAMCS